MVNIYNSESEGRSFREFIIMISILDQLSGVECSVRVLDLSVSCDSFKSSRLSFLCSISRGVSIEVFSETCCSWLHRRYTYVGFMVACCFGMNYWKLPRTDISFETTHYDIVPNKTEIQDDPAPCSKPPVDIDLKV